MATKKTIKDGLTFGADMDDLEFDTFDFGEPKERDVKKRKPITKIIFGAAKGMASALTSENTIRNVIAKALPGGFSATVDSAFDARDSAEELYHSAADEWQKMAPDARRLVQKIVPHSSRVLPKRLQDRLKAFANGGSPEYQQENPDEATLRRVMGELEGVSQQERSQERAEDAARDAIHAMAEGKRHQQSQRVLASIDARLARINAFNDQAFARYQKRSLEIQYRSFFVQRDLLKVQMQASADTREAMRALIHNTALPDMDKRTLGDRARNEVRRGIRGAAELGINSFMRNYFGDARKRLQSHLQNMLSGAGMALSMGNMGLDQASMMNSMGMDATKEVSMQAGQSLMNTLLGHLAGHVSQGFRRSGATAQAGGRLSRLLNNAQTRVANWAGQYDSTLLGQILLNPLKDILGGGFRENRVIGRNALREAGDPGTFTKRTQRSIEEVMPEYLSRILHELQMTRSGPGVKRLVYNEDQNKFTTVDEQSRDMRRGLLDSGEARMSREAVNAFASKILGGAKVSDRTYAALQQEIARMTHSGEELSLKRLQSRGEFIDQAAARELRQALRGRFRGNLARGTDQTIVADLDRDFHGLRRSVQDPLAFARAAHDMGYTQFLRNQGLVHQEGDNFVFNTNDFIRQQYNAKSSEQRDYTRDVSENMGGDIDYRMLAADSLNRRDLYKTPDAKGPPVILARLVLEGAYASMKTGQAIYYMHDLADGVTQGGRIVATPEQVAKLYFANGQTYGDWAKQTPRPQESTGRFARMQNAVKDRARQFGAWSDRQIDRLAGHARQYGVDTPAGRRRAAAAAAASAQQAVSDLAKEDMASPQAQAAQAAAQQAVNRGKQAGLRALVRLRRQWRKAVSAVRYGQDLYAGGGFTAVIDAAKLKAGDYYSAKTGKVITDLRDLVDGVKSKTGEWIAHPEEILELQTKSGYSFKTLMADLQAGLDKVQAQAEVASQQARETMGTTFAAAQASPAGQAATHAAEAARATATSVREAVAQQAAAATVTAAASPELLESMEGLLTAITSFRDGNLEYLEHILEALHTGVATGPGTAAPVDGARRESFMDRMRKTRLGLLGRWGSAAVHGVGRAARAGGRLYRRYVGGVFGLMGRALRAPVGIARWTFGGDRNHRGKEAADVFVGDERQPRLTAGGMLAGDYVWVDAKTGKVGGPVKAPADIKGPVMSADGKSTLISADDLRNHPVSDRHGYSIARRTLGFLARGVGGLAGMYGSIFRVPFRMAAWAGSIARDLITGRNRAIDIYVRGDTPWEPRVTAMGMRRGIYVVRGHLGMTHPVRNLKDVTGDVYDISQGTPQLVLSAADFAPPKGLVDINHKPLHIHDAFLKKVGRGIWAGLGTGLGGLARLGGSMLRAGASLAAAPFKMLHGLLTGQGLINLSLFGGGGPRKVTKTDDEQTHALLTEILKLLDGRLPETEHYRRGSWQEALANRGKRAAGGVKEAAKRAGNSLTGMWSRLKDLFHRKDEDGEGDEEGGGNTYIDASGRERTRVGRDAQGRVRGSRARNQEARRRRALRRRGFRGAALEEELAKGGRFKRLLRRIPGAGRAGSLLSRGRGLLGRAGSAVAASRLGRVAGGIGRFGGRLAGGLGGLASMAGGYFLDKYAASHKGTLGGELAGAGSTAANVAGYASTGATLAGMAGVDVAGAAAGAASGIAGAAGSAVSATAALISNPVGWAILGAMAAGAAAYGIYKFVSKVHDLKKDEPLRAYRLAQYGIDIKGAKWRANDVLKLENILLPLVRMEGGKAHIDQKGYAKVENDVLRIFDLGYAKWNPAGWIHSWFHHDTVDDVKRRQDFHQWLIWRFRPVFLTWYVAVHNAAPNVQLADIDDKLTATQKEAVLKAAKGLPAGVYATENSPFDGSSLTTGKDEQALLKATAEAADAAIKKAKKDEAKPGTKGAAPGKAPEGTKPGEAPKSRFADAVRQGAAAGALGGLGMLASGAAMAATGTTVSGAAGAGTIAALMSNPVGWTIAGAIAAGAIGFGIYKFVAKIHDLRKDEPFRAYRMAQYGVDIKSHIWRANDILKLENLLLPIVKMQGGKAFIDPKGYAKVENDVLRIFDLGYSKWNPMGYLRKWFHATTLDDVKRKEAFHKWLLHRFRPVFLSWYTALHQVSATTQFAEVDDKLKPDEKTKLLNLVKAIPASVLAVSDSPFENVPLASGSDGEALLKATLAACNEAIKKANPAGAQTGTGSTPAPRSVPPAPGTAVAAASRAGQATSARENEQARLAHATTTAPGMQSGGIPIAATADFQSKFAFLGGALTALQAVRYKTYGLTDFKPEQVKAVFLLETDLLDKLDYDANGVATYKGPVDFWFNGYAGYFGIAGSDAKAKERWYSWFSKRFLPVLLQFATGVKKANKNVDPRDADSYLDASQILGVANLIIATNFVKGKDSVSVWTLTDSPYDDKPLNADSKSVNDNLQVLKNNADKMALQAATAKPPTSGQTGNAPSTRPGVSTQMASRQAPNTQISASGYGMPPMGTGGIGSAGAGGMLGSGPSTPVGQPVPQPGGGTGGDINKIPVPTGSGYTNLRATLDAAAKMVGVDPTVLATFAGIESSYNPAAHAGTSSAAGLGQFLSSTWRSMMAKYAKTYGINPATPPTDPRAGAIMLGLYIKENAAYLKRVLGRDPTDTELYMAHFLGPAGAKELISMPNNALAAQAMPGPATANRSIFFTPGGGAATKAQVAANLDGRVKHWRTLVQREGPATATELAANTTKPGEVRPGSIAPPMSAGTRAASVAAAITGGGAASNDPVAATRSIASAKASAADAQALATSSAAKAQNAAMVNHAQAQTEYQRQMVEHLNTIANHTGRTADTVASLSSNSATDATDTSGAVANADGSSSTPTSAGIPTDVMPALPVSMAHRTWNDRNS